MLLKFEQRPSPSPFIERVWCSYSYGAGSFYSMAEPNLEFVDARLAGRAQVILRRPVTKARSPIVPPTANGSVVRARPNFGYGPRAVSYGRDLTAQIARNTPIWPSVADQGMP